MASLTFDDLVTGDAGAPAPATGALSFDDLTPQDTRKRRSEMGWGEYLGDLVTGSGSTEFADAPEFLSAYMASSKQPDGTTKAVDLPAVMRSAISSDPKAQLDILKSNIPGIESREDRFGNMMLKAPGMTEWAYMNKPGASERDMDEFGTQLLATLPFGAIAGLGKSLLARMGSGAAAFGSASVGQDALAMAAGSEQGIDPQKALISAGIGSVANPVMGFVGDKIAARAAPAAIAPTAQQEITEAGARIGVDLPRAATGTGEGVAQVVKEAPTIVENPIRTASQKALDDIASATERTLASASDNHAPADAARRGLTDWLLGRTKADTAADELAALRAGAAPEAAPAPAVGQDGAVQRIVTPDQSMEIGAKPQLVELSDLRLAEGRFQPRDRSRVEYAQEARERASRLDPEQLKPGRVSDSGAPILLDDGTIISGNGRAMSIAEVYTNPALAERAAQYRASLGPEAASMKQPVLVMRADAMSPDDAARFADLSNRGRIAAMSAPERAARDVQALGDDSIALYQGGDFTAPQNAAFLRTFTDKAVGSSERAAFSKNGELTQEGVQRMRAAVLQGAYDDAPMLSRMLESTDDNIRNVTGALQDAAPGFAQLRADVRAGIVADDMDATPQVVAAVKMIGDLRSRGVSPATHFAQKDAFDQGDPVVEAWVRAFYNDDLTRPVSREKMTAVLKAYTEEARKHQPGGLFVDETSAGDVLNVARKAGSTVDEAGAVGNQSPGMGASLRDGGESAGRQAPPAISGEPPAGGIGPEGVGRATEARVGSEGGPRVLSAEASQAAVIRNLTEARKVNLAKAIGEQPESISPERVMVRFMEMSRSKLPADVSGLVKARQLIGDDAWKDVSTGVLHKMGATDNAWDVLKFAQAWNGMTENGRNVLFSGAGRDGLRQSLDDLAKVAALAPKLQSLSKSALEDIPWIGGIVRTANRPAVQLGSIIFNPLHTIHVMTGQAPAYLTARYLSQPATVKQMAKFSQSFVNAVSDASNKTKFAMLQLSARQLADTIAKDSGLDSKEVERKLMGE